MANTCRICGNNEANQTFTAKEMMYDLRETFEYFECSNCGGLQITEFPTDMSKKPNNSTKKRGVIEPLFIYARNSFIFANL